MLEPLNYTELRIVNMGVISNGTTLLDAGALDSGLATGSMTIISTQSSRFISMIFPLLIIGKFSKIEIV